jgi:antitoxin ParD1/3/4
MRMTSINIMLPEELKDYVEEQTKGAYGSTNEFICHLIRQDQRRRVKQRLEELLIEGLESGESVEADEAFWTELETETASGVNRRASSEAHKRK